MCAYASPTATQQKLSVTMILHTSVSNIIIHCFVVWGVKLTTPHYLVPRFRMSGSHRDKFIFLLVCGSFRKF